MCLDIDDPHITTTQWWWELWGLFPHFFFIRDFSQDIFSYAKNYAKKTFQKRVFFSCGRVGLCVKEFKCLYTRHFVRGEQQSLTPIYRAHWDKTPLFIQNSLEFDFWKCEFGGKSVSLLWILWKMRFSKHEFCENWDF